jgi:hypothetical protein
MRLAGSDCWNASDTASSLATAIPSRHGATVVGVATASAGHASTQDASKYEAPDAIQKVVIVLYPLLLAFVAAIIWTVLWFGLYAVN